MALIKQPILTIAIPTYNRAKFLDHCLASITIQILNKNYLIEIIVSDNCSTDHTPEVIEKYISEGVEIKNIKNIENKGPDFNIAQCFLEAKGKHVLILGDDDFLIEEAIDKLMAILEREPATGILYLKGKPYDDKFKILGRVKNTGAYSLYTDKLEFVKRVNYNFTFISGNIINKDLFLGEITQNFYNTYLLQLSWVFTVLINSANNIVIEDDILGIGSTDNTGGYKLYDVFVKNFNNNMHFLKKDGFSSSYIDVINNNLLLTFFPGMIVKDRNTNPGLFLKESPSKLLHQYYKGNVNYWFVIFPLLHLPKFFLKHWLYMLYFYNKVRNVIIRIDYRRNVYLKKVIIKYK